MCGRFALVTPPESLAALFEAGEDDWDEEFPPDAAFAPRYNIAPTQPIICVRADVATGRRRLRWAHWGLVPSWAKDPAIGARMINARSETAAEKPSFRSAMRHRRCVVPADHFYEWRREGKDKQAYCIRARDRRPMAFAGLWEHWSAPDGSELTSCAVLTTSANGVMTPIHDRMPVILAPGDIARWLDPAVQKAEGVADLMRPFADDALEAFTVSSYVNNARNEGARCAAPVMNDEI